jgi:hypothetical protein
MKKSKLEIILWFIIMNLLIMSTVLSQTDTVKASWYARVMPYSICTGGGSLNNNISIAPTISRNIETGVSYGVIDLGLCYGSYSNNLDTTSFGEIKLTMDASQYGIFSNEFSLGVGRIFNSATPILLDASYTIMAQLPHKLGLGVTTGYYDFVGRQYDISKIYYGFFIRYGLLRDMNGGLNRTRNHHRKK